MQIPFGAGLAGVGLVFLFGAASPAIAQTPVEIQASAPEKPPQIRIEEPTPATREATRPREADFYGTDVRVRYQPAFIEPFVGQTGGTKYGLSGWTSPSTPVGSLVSQEPWARSPGWFSLGLTVVWDSPPAASTRRVSDPR